MAVKDVGNLRTRLSWEDEGATNSLTRFREDLKGLRSEMRTVTSQGKEYTNSLKGLKQQQDVLNRELKTHQERVKELKLRYEESVKAKGEDAKQTRNLNTQYNNAVAQLNETEQKLNKVTQAIKDQQNPWKNLSKDLDTAGKKFQTVGDKMSDFGRSYSTKVTAPIVAGGTAIFKASMDFESAFAGVEKTFSGTEQQLQDLRVSIRDMAKEIPASTTEIAAVAEAAGQLGIETESIEMFTRTMIDLGEATNMTADVAATEFARFANIVGMSQEDFDRLGSSVVALGNTTATTEAEISSMAMRLAAQGSQVGMTEAQIMALAATMSSLGIEAEAGGTAMTTVLKKIQNAVSEGGIELELFAKAANMSSTEFKKAFEKDAISALDALIKGLAKSSGEGKNLTTILDDLGIKGIREADTMLRMAGASDLLSEAVNTSTTAWKENTALTNEAEQRYKTTESRLKILWNRIKDTAISLGDALAPAIMDALDAAEPFIKGIEKGARAFSEMDKEQQRSILKLIGLVAAIGPASMALGGLSKGIGSVLTIGSKFAGVMGLAPGGLAASLGTIAGPAALATVGIAGLAALVISVKKDIEKAKKVNLEHAESLVKQQSEVETLSVRFKELQDKNKLSNDELLRLRDIQDELKFATTAEEVKLLKDEQAKLQEKSGLTNDELDEMLTLNDNLIKLVPEVEKALSSHGNAIITDAEALDKANEKLKRNIELELENQRIKAEAQLNTNIREYLNSLDELNKKEAERNKLVKERDKTEKEIADLRIKAQDQINSGKDKEAEKTIDEIANLKILLGEQNSRLIQLADEVTEKQKSVEKSQEEIEKTQKLYDKMIDLQLAAAGINATGAEGIAQLDSAIEKTQKRIEELQKIKKEQGSLNTEQQKELEKLLTKLGLYENTKTKIKEIQGEQSSVNTKIDAGILKAGELTKELGKDAKKNVDIDDKGKAKDLDEEIRKSVTKKVTLKAIWEGIKLGAKQLPFFAEGTKGAPGGPAVVGEEGPELARHKNKWALLNHGIVDLPRGTEVFTYDETKKILNAITRMNRIPAYADGISTPGAFEKILSQLDSQTPSNIFNFEGMMQGSTFVVREEADIHKIARALHKLTKDKARGKGVIIG